MKGCYEPLDLNMNMSKNGPQEQQEEEEMTYFISFTEELLGQRETKTNGMKYLYLNQNVILVLFILNKKMSWLNFS